MKNLATFIPMKPGLVSYPIIWHWTDREGFRRDSFWETSREIFRQPRRGRLVMCADADVIFVRDFSELLTELSASPAIAGAIAHGPPFRDVDVQQTWRDSFKAMACWTRQRSTSIRGGVS